MDNDDLEALLLRGFTVWELHSIKVTRKLIFSLSEDQQGNPWSLFPQKLLSCFALLVQVASFTYISNILFRFKNFFKAVSVCVCVYFLISPENW